MIHLPCPSCGFLTLENFYGSYDICPLCNWEDDGVQLANPTSGGGANSESLAQAQNKALAKFPLEVDILGVYHRCSSWRPLSHAEVEHYETLKSGAHWHFKAVLQESDAYWLSPNNSFNPDALTRTG